MLEGFKRGKDAPLGGASFLGFKSIGATPHLMRGYRYEKSEIRLAATRQQKPEVNDALAIVEGDVLDYRFQP